MDAYVGSRRIWPAEIEMYSYYSVIKIDWTVRDLLECPFILT